MSEVDETGREADWDSVEIIDLDTPGRAPTRRRVIPRLVLSWWILPRRRRRVFGGVAAIALTLLVVLALSGGELFSVIGKSFGSAFGAGETDAPEQISGDFLNAIKKPVSPSVFAGQDGLACLVDAQWSPDSSAIAVLGYQNNCPRANEQPGILNIYNARTGKLKAQWQTDDTIIHVLNAPEGNSHPSSQGTCATLFRAGHSSQNTGGNRIIPFSYQRVLWSPDGRRLAITFVATIQQQALNGLLYMNVDGTNTQVVLQPPGISQGPLLEWDLSSGQAVPLAPLAPALVYRWGTGGTLVPVTPLSNRVVAPEAQGGPVGNPDGSSIFTIWQPGYTALTNIAGMAVWSVSFAAWSPDGRYVVDGLSILGLMNPPGHALPGAQALAALRLQHFSLLAPRDVALERVSIQSPFVSWRPDGRVLAAYNYYNVTLYDCQTGRLLRMLNLQDEPAPLLGSTALLRWSPDGTRLLLSSANEGVLNIWGPGTLGALPL
jgi:WD40 repeat protein